MTDRQRDARPDRHRFSGKTADTLRDELQRFGRLNAEDEERLYEIENGPHCRQCGGWISEDLEVRNKHERDDCPNRTGKVEEMI